MTERFNPGSYLLTRFSTEGAGIPLETRKLASALSIELSRFMLQSPTLSPSYEDSSRIKRAPHIVHFAAGGEYDGFVQKYMQEAEKKSLPIDSLLEAALRRGSVYLNEGNMHESTGLTIFPTGSDQAHAVIIRKPQDSIISIDHFLNVLSEEMIHAAAPQSLFLRWTQKFLPSSEISPLDLFELMGRWIKFEFLEFYKEQYNIPLLPGEDSLQTAKNMFIKKEEDYQKFKNLYLRGRYGTV